MLGPITPFHRVIDAPSFRAVPRRSPLPSERAADNTEAGPVMALKPRDYTALQALRVRVASDIARALRCDRSRLPALYAEARRLAMLSLGAELGR